MEEIDDDDDEESNGVRELRCPRETTKMIRTTKEQSEMMKTKM